MIKSSKTTKCSAENCILLSSTLNLLFVLRSVGPKPRARKPPVPVLTVDSHPLPPFLATKCRDHPDGLTMLQHADQQPDSNTLPAMQDLNPSAIHALRYRLRITARTLQRRLNKAQRNQRLPPIVKNPNGSLHQPPIPLRARPRHQELVSGQDRVRRREHGRPHNHPLILQRQGCQGHHANSKRVDQYWQSQGLADLGHQHGDHEGHQHHESSSGGGAPSFLE